MVWGMSSSLQPRPTNPIAQRKQAVRKHARAAVTWTGGGVASGVVLGLLAGSWTLLVLCVVVGVAMGGVNWAKVRRIVNHRDQA